MLDKNTLREISYKKRGEIYKADDGMAARLVASKVIMLPEFDDVKPVSVYYPINDELDGLTILKALHAAFFPVCLPTIKAKNQALEFREWDLDSSLIDGPFGTKQSAQNVVTPEILLIPLLAFDINGHRLGYGGGYYDRTLFELRKNNPKILAIGVAYDGQKQDELPNESHDQKLNMVVTEKEIYRFE